MSSDELTPETIEVRRNRTLALVVGGTAALLAVLFALRGVNEPVLLDWFLFGVLAMIAAAHLSAVVDSRAPLVVVDDQGVRVREGATWTGIGWSEVECLEHLPRRGLRDGHLLVVGPTLEQYVVPMTLATRFTGATTVSISDDLAALARGRADVVEVMAGLDEDEYDAPPTDPDDTVDLTDVRRATPTEVPAVAAGGSHVTDEESGGASREDAGSGLPSPVKMLNNLLHRGDRAPAYQGANALASEAATEVMAAVPEEETAVRVIAAAEPATTSVTVPVAQLVDAEEDTPVIGPELRAARERLRLSVDQLAERTRIRPHVVEAIEVDDFAACGGDFYARGHLRTLGRVLGVESGPLVAAYDERYAHAPVDPKRVFASEMASVGGAIRGTRGGRNWSVLVAAVMAAVLMWSVAKMALDSPVPVGDTPVLNQSGGLAEGHAHRADAVPVTLTAVGGGARIVVRDGTGDVVFDSRLAFGQSTRLDIVPPVRIQSSDGSVTAAIDGKDAEPLGETGREAAKTLVP
jgi:hypothetical protein